VTEDYGPGAAAGPSTAGKPTQKDDSAPRASQARTAAVLLVAGGAGSRLAGPEKKQFAPLRGVPLLLRALRPFEGQPGLTHAIVVVPAQDLTRSRDLVDGEMPGFSIRFVAGGVTRQESVWNGLQVAPPVDVVLIHDAARPLASRGLVQRALEIAYAGEGAVPALPISDTLKRLTGEGLTTVPREGLYAAQTPQAFPREMIQTAHRRAVAEGLSATDDGALCEHYGFPVRLLPGEPSNLKITTPEDWKLAESLLVSDASRSGVRTGIGYDIHPLVAGRACILGGVRIDAPRGPAGYSDADVLLHAIMDALLGAAGEPDIGHRFPADDPRYVGANSLELLREIREAVSDRFEIQFVDAILVAELPRIAPHVAQMRGRIAGALGISPERVNVKATTAEGLGAVGRGEGIAAQAVVTLYERSGSIPPRPGAEVGP
jgi:2-C-methyl-D-erythritol 4-phosphate cytidylyltransferase/2-C-methyl-D-erythritol 2,4-cyclodiphosphate synthase